MKKILIIATVLSLISPVLFLAYHRLIGSYIEFLWPDVQMYGVGAFFSILAAMISGGIISAILIEKTTEK